MRSIMRYCSLIPARRATAAIARATTFTKRHRLVCMDASL